MKQLQVVLMSGFALAFFGCANVALKGESKIEYGSNNNGIRKEYVTETAFLPVTLDAKTEPKRVFVRAISKTELALEDERPSAEKPDREYKIDIFSVWRLESNRSRPLASWTEHADQAAIQKQMLRLTSFGPSTTGNYVRLHHVPTGAKLIEFDRDENAFEVEVPNSSGVRRLVGVLSRGAVGFSKDEAAAGTLAIVTYASPLKNLQRLRIRAKGWEMRPGTLVTTSFEFDPNSRNKVSPDRQVSLWDSNGEKNPALGLNGTTLKIELTGTSGAWIKIPLRNDQLDVSAASSSNDVEIFN